MEVRLPRLVDQSLRALWVDAVDQAGRLLTWRRLLPCDVSPNVHVLNVRVVNFIKFLNSINSTTFFQTSVSFCRCFSLLGVVCTYSLPGGWRQRHSTVVLVEVFVPFTAYKMLALSADPVDAYHNLMREFKAEFNVTLKLF